MDSLEHIVCAARLDDPLERGRVLDEVAHALFSTPRPPPQLGRYRVLERIGGGGQGVVYAGIDPRLARAVAIKILRVAPGDGQASDRLRQEAMALAQLAHPNVIAIHDVGTFAGGVYIVMQRVPGCTLGAWLRTPRSWRAVLTIFDGAGRGLVAAHRARIVHRDFKPDNVWIGDDGGVRLLDFGLARASADVDVAEHTGSHGDARAGAPPSTATGMVVGTPAYMAPEQHDGEPVTAASDQYAYCVALFEALHGRKPFAGDSLGELVAAKRGGVPEPIARTVPGKLHRIVARGLQPDPARRWPSMDALLRALDRVAHPGRRTALRLAAPALGAAVVAGFWLAGGPPPRECVGHDLAAQAWSSRAGRVTTAIEDSALPFAGDVAIRVTHSADAFTARWRSARVQACAAIERDPSADLQIRCLDRLAAQLGDTLDILADGGVDLVEHADELVRALPDPSRCALPPERSTEHDELRRAIAHARALGVAGRSEPALAAARITLADAEAVGDDALQGEAGEVYGDLLLDLGRVDAAIEMLEAAYLRATAASADDVAFEAALRLVDLFASSRQDPPKCGEWVQHAAAAHARGQPADAVAQGRLALARAKHGFTSGAYEQAAAHAEQAATLLEASDDLRAIAALDTRARLLANLERDDEALAVASHGVELAERMRGPDHPSTAGALQTLATMVGSRGDVDDALTMLARVREIQRSAWGSDDLRVAEATRNIAGVHARAGHHAEAAAGYREVLEIQRRHLPAGDPKLAQTLYNLSLPLRSAGEHGQAEALGREAVVLAEASIGVDHPTTAIYLHGLGETLCPHDPAAALELLARGRTIVARALGPAHGLHASFTTSIEGCTREPAR